MDDINPDDVAALHNLKLRFWAKKCPRPDQVGAAIAKNDQDRATVRDKLLKIVDDGKGATQRRWRLERVMDDLCFDMRALEELSAMFAGPINLDSMDDEL